jgi:Tfp pilus assembly protein PilO
MAHTITENIGMIQSVIAYMQDNGNQAALAAKNFEVAPHITRLQGKLDTINKLHTEDEQLKVSLRQKSADFSDAMDDGYRDTSGLVDAMMGLLGKGTPAANSLQGLRSRIRQGGGGNSPAPSPVASAK